MLVRVLASLMAVCVWGMGIAAHGQEVGTILWEDQGLPSDSSLPSPFVITEGARTVTVTSELVQDGGVTLPGLADFITYNDGSLGGPGGNVIFVMDNDSFDLDDRIVLTVEFDAPVTDLQFNVLEIDTSATADEGLEVFFDDGSGFQNIADNPAFFTLGGPNITLDDIPGVNGFEGDGTGSGTDADLVVDFASQPVLAVRIEFFTADDGAPDPGFLLSGVGDLSWTVPVADASDLSVEVMPTAFAPFIGGSTTLKVNVENGGAESATNVQVSAPLQDGFSYIDDTSAGAYDPVTGIWTVPGPLAPGASATLSLLAQLEPVGPYTFAAEVAASDLPDPDSTPGNFATAPGEDDGDSLTLVPRAASEAVIFCLGRPVSDLAFVAPQLISGIDGQPGAVYRYFEVAPNVDAEVRITAFNDGASLEVFDNDAGLVSNFQPELNSVGADSSVDFEVSFFDAGDFFATGTNTPVGLDFAASTIDVDGGGALREYTEFSNNLVEFFLNDPTLLVQDASPPSAPNRTRFEPISSATAPGIDETASEHIVTSFYTDVRVYEYRIGAFDSGAGATRLTSLAFNCPTLNTPAPVSAIEEDFGDAPISYGNPIHTLEAGVQLGATITADLGPFDSADASGDAGDDGAILPTFEALVPASFDVAVSGAGGFLQAWADWNGDGDFADAGEQFASDVQDEDGDGAITLELTPPVTALGGDLFVRLRWSTASAVDPIEAAGDGEVEDYVTSLVAAPVIVAENDSASAEAGTANVLNVLDNDTIDGAPFSSFDLSLAPGATLPPQLSFDPATGAVGIVDGAGPPGDFSFDYQICETSAQQNCQIATVTVTILTAPGSGPILTCPAGFFAASATGQLLNLIDGSGSLAPDAALGPLAPEGTEPPDAISAELNGGGDTLILDFGILVPGGAEIVFSLARDGGGANEDVIADIILAETEAGLSSAAAVATYGLGQTIEPGPQDILERITVTVPGTGIRFVEIDTLNGDDLFVDGAEYTSACFSAVAAVTATDDVGAGEAGTSFVLNVLANDTIDGVQPDTFDLSIAPGSSLPPELVFDPATGTVGIAGAGVIPGDYSFDYQLCQTVLQFNCDTATVTITVIPLGSGGGTGIACPAGFFAAKQTGQFATLIDGSGVLNPELTLGPLAPEGTTPPDPVAAEVNGAGDTLILDFGVLVPGGAEIFLSITRDGGTGGGGGAGIDAQAAITLAPDLTSLASAPAIGVYGAGLSIPAGPQDVLERVSIIVPSGGGRFMDIDSLNAQDFFIDGAEYNDVCLAIGELSGGKVTQVFDPDNEGLFAIPGNDVTYTITIANEGPQPTDADSVLIIDQLPSEVEFFNGDVDGPSLPETGVVAVDLGTSGLTFDEASDLGFSNSTVRPASFADCNYTPLPGYDPAVSFICFAPKGQMLAGDPDPEFQVSFRARIR